MLSKPNVLHYVLDADGEPRPESDLLVWGRWFETADRKVRVTTIGQPPILYISTVFLGLDHRFVGEGPPILWETMTFAADGVDFRADKTDENDVGIQKRYATRATALDGHDALVRILREKYE